MPARRSRSRSARSDAIDSLEQDEAVQRACGWQPGLAKDILFLVNSSLEERTLALTCERCHRVVQRLEEAVPQRRASDGGIYQLLKAIALLLRKRGFDRKTPVPFEELEIDGHPLVAPSARREEEAALALEQVVHLVRASSEITVVRLTNCAILGQHASITEVGRLLKQMGAGATAHFLREVDLSQNLLDDESARKIVETAIKERCERGSGEGARGPLWLDLSSNCIKQPQMLFDRLQAWASWAYREGALCLAQSPKCTKEACPRGALLHLPRFLEQGREASRVVLLERGEMRKREEERGAKNMPENGRPSVRLLPAQRPRVQLVERRSRSRSAKLTVRLAGARGPAGQRDSDPLESSEADEGEESEEEVEGEEEEDCESDDSQICGCDVEAAPIEVACERDAQPRDGSSEERAPLSKDKIEEKLDRLLSKLSPPAKPVSAALESIPEPASAQSNEAHEP